jgi:flavin-dependent dehydrogenase
MKRECIIIGGGVTGLCAAIRLTELGVKPLLIEAGEYPAHKVCGEFFSPECLGILTNWGIQPPLISYCKWHGRLKTLKFSFPTPAGSLSHFTIDPLLLQKALLGGATVLTKTKVSQLRPGKEHQIELSTGETITTPQLILATGRLPELGQTAPRILYKGIKAHFNGIPITDSLEMFSFDGAYVGLSPIEEGKCNVACLSRIAPVERQGGPGSFMQYLMGQNALLKDYLSQGENLFEEWLHVAVPSFGLKITPDWPNTYFIGDAAGTIPPATGSGLSMAITAGILAAEYATVGDATGFKKAWRQRYHSQISWGKRLHHLLMSPSLGDSLLTLGTWFPFLVEHLFKRTR